MQSKDLKIEPGEKEMNPDDVNEVKGSYCESSSGLVMLFVLAGDGQLRIVFFHSHIFVVFMGKHHE